MVALAVRDETARTAAVAVARHAADIDAAAALVFSSAPGIEPDSFARACSEEAPGLRVLGCSTAGEMTPEGIGEGTMLSLILPGDAFFLSTLTIENCTTSDMDAVAEGVARLRERHLLAAPRDEATFALCLIDGMSYCEEKITAAIFWGLNDIPLIGGSAGDQLAFRETHVMADGTARTDRAVVAMITTGVPFRIFKSDNFVPMETKFVVTASDPDRRVVMELNARPAAVEYAEAVGRPIEELDQPGFASHPVVVRVGGEQFCRAIRGLDEETGALLFACAIDDGVVLTLAEARGMVDSTSRAMRSLDDELGGIDFVLGFDCAYRRIDAANRQVLRKMSDLYQAYNVVGFGTYGEQYHSMHLNQTLTGVAFGRRVPGVCSEAAE
ncbi:MAG: FIST C-terminal domain-containing protein [Rhizobiaceae bacterium]|nr:FIST C-terminal domain-containing protein [Rhizobiaceae bacterium]MCV0409198.1 FIST C-terminal domain-containing protein [Rhizobiaceae bacterium]